MAGEEIVAAAPVEAPVVVAPVAAAPVAAPAEVVAPVEAPAAAEATPVVDVKADAVPPEAKPTESAPVEKPASLLAEAGKETAEAAPIVDPAAPVPVPTFEAFTLPEGVTVSEDGLKGVTDLLGEFESTTKADHRVVQELGQKFVDMYVQQKAADAQVQADNWVNTRKAWQEEVKSDPIYGRNRHETFLRDAALVRDKFGSERFKQMIDLTGAGDHPGMMDFVHNIAKFMDKNGLLREGKPVPAPTQKAIPQKTGPRARYTATSVQ